MHTSIRTKMSTKPHTNKRINKEEIRPGFGRTSDAGELCRCRLSSPTRDWASISRRSHCGGLSGAGKPEAIFDRNRQTELGTLLVGPRRGIKHTKLARENFHHQGTFCRRRLSSPPGTTRIVSCLATGGRQLGP